MRVVKKTIIKQNHIYAPALLGAPAHRLLPTHSSPDIYSWRGRDLARELFAPGMEGLEAHHRPHQLELQLLAPTPQLQD